MRRLLPVLLCGVVLGCAGTEQHANSSSAPPPRDTKINRVHEDVKDDLATAADKAKSAAESVQKELHKGAQEAGRSLGVRSSVTGNPPASSPKTEGSPTGTDPH
jgi:hypothetical protein